MPRMTVAVLVAIGFSAVLGLAAQSQTPFGIPTADQPVPASAIPAVPGSRAQGWLAQGRSEVLARHGVVATSDPLAAQAGLEIMRRGGNAIDAAVAAGAVLDVTSQNDTGIGGDLFALVWSARDKKLYALASAGWAPAGWTPQFFTDRLRVKSVPEQRRQRGDRAGRDRRLRRAAEEVRDAAGFKETFEPAARIAEEGWGLAERRHDDLRGAVKGLLADPDSRQTFLAGDAAPRALQHHPESRPREGAAADPAAGTRRVLPRRDRRGDREEGPGERRRDEPRGPRGVPAGMGRADLDQLSRLRRLPAAAAGAGHGGARDAEHPRGVRAEAGLQPGEARSGRSDVLAPAGRGEEAGLRRSAREERRSEVRRRAGQGAALEVVRGDAVRSHQPGSGGEAGRDRRHRWRDDLSDDRRPLGQHGVAHPQRVQRLRQPRDGARRSASCCTTAAAPSRSTRRARTSSRRASGRSTRSSPAS